MLHQGQFSYAHIVLICLAVCDSLYHDATSTHTNTVTACGKSQLRSMPVGRLRNYLDAYGIKPKSAIEKENLIEAIIDARVRA